MNVLRVEAYQTDLPLHMDRIHVANGTLFLDGSFTEEQDYCRTAAFTMDVYGHVSRQMQLNCANKLETFIQNVQPNRELESAAQAPEIQEPCPI